MASFIRPEFSIPEGFQTDKYKLRILTIHDLVKDFDAVISSQATLIGIFGPNNNWPTGLTLEQNLIDLGWHQKEFQQRRSFAFTVLSPDEQTCLGCVYIEPCEKQGFDAQAILWVRQDRLPMGLDAHLDKHVKSWLDQAWPFKQVAFPGRDIPWKDWSILPEKMPAV